MPPGCCEVGTGHETSMGTGKGRENAWEKDCKSSLKLFVLLFLISSITGRDPSGGAARPLSAPSLPSRHPLPGGKSAALGSFHLFTHAKAYLISGLLWVCLGLVPQTPLGQVNASPKPPLGCAFGVCKISVALLEYPSPPQSQSIREYY